MKWKTKISTHKDGELYVRGAKLTDNIGTLSFIENLYFVLQGKKPTEKEAALLDAILVASCEHGVEAPSAFVPRTVASTGNSVNAAIAAGALAIGEHHGGAIECAAKFLQSEKSAAEIVSEAVSKKERLAGFGHKIYKNIDPRTDVIFKKAETLGLAGASIKKVQDIQAEIAKQMGKELCINIDGAIAAVMCELKLPWQLGKAFFILGRMPGMMAHIYEEMTEEKPYRRLEEGDVEYQGPAV